MMPAHPVPIAFDLETHLFGTGNMAPPAVCMTSTDEYGVGDIKTKRTRPSLDDMFRARAWAAQESGHVLVGHNVAYDMAVLYQNYPDLRAFIFDLYDNDMVLDTMVRQKLLDIARGIHFARKGRYSLAGLIKRYNIPAVPAIQKVYGSEPDLDALKTGEDAWRLRYAELEDVPLEDWPAEAVAYAVGDAEYTWEVYQAQVERCHQMDYHLPDQFDQTRAAFALHLSAVWGIETDKAEVAKLSAAVDGQLATLRERLLEAGLLKSKTKRDGTVVYSKSAKELQRRVVKHCHAHGIPLAVTEKGNVKTDVLTLQELITNPEEWVGSDFDTWLKFAGFEKTKSTYITKLNQPITHPRPNVLVDTGRTSYGQPNLQNLPRAELKPDGSEPEKGYDGPTLSVRQCYTARPGWVFVASDYDSQEMRTFAQVCLWIAGYSKLAERYQADPGFDPHTAFAAEGLIEPPITYAEGMELKKAGDKELKKLRQEAKIPNFGFPGGMGPDSTVMYAKGMGVDMSLSRATELRDRWRAQWPEVQDYFAHISSLVGRGGRGELRQFVSGRVRGGVGYCQAANSYFQGLAADMSKDALYRISRECYVDHGTVLFGCRIVVFVHDEVILEVPEEIGHEAAMRVKELMEAAGEVYCPDVPIRAGAHLMRRWIKNAEAVHDGNGRLIPWEDRKAS